MLQGSDAFKSTTIAITIYSYHLLIAYDMPGTIEGTIRLLSFI